MKKIVALLLSLSLTLGGTFSTVTAYAMEDAVVEASSIVDVEDVLTEEESEESSADTEDDINPATSEDEVITDADADESEESEEASEPADLEKPEEPENSEATEESKDDEEIETPEESEETEESEELLESIEEETLLVEDDSVLFSTNAPFDVEYFRPDSSDVKMDKYDKVTVVMHAPEEIYYEDVCVYWEVSDPDVSGWQKNETSFYRDGTTENTFYSNQKVGLFDVTVTISPESGGETSLTGQTEASFTIAVDGIDFYQNTGYYNGAPIEGFVNCNKDGTGLTVGKIDLDAYRTYYFDPETHKMATGIYKIGSKLYYFGLSDYLEKNAKRIGNESCHLPDDFTKSFCIDKYGEVKTGWQKTSDNGKERYFSPETGLLVKNSYVPRGNGLVLVDFSGACADGLIDIEGDNYYFKNGSIVTGFVYFDASGKQVSQAKAKYARFFDPYDSKKGIERRKSFIYKGNEYRTVSWPVILPDGTKVPEGGIPLNTLFNNRLNISYNDKSGICQKNKLLTFGGKQYYLDENGYAIIDTEKIINGKVCYFGKDGSMTAIEAGTPSDYCFDPECTQIAYQKSANPKKLTSGVYYYEDAECTKKLTNCFLYAKYFGPVDFPSAYLDGNGNRVTGIRKIGGETYYFDQYGFVILGQGVIEYKGKRYLTDPDNIGRVLTGETGWKYLPIGDKTTKEVGRFYYIKDKSGELAVGKTVIDGKTYFFNNQSSGINAASLCYGGLYNGFYYVNGKRYSFEMNGTTYICNHSGQPHTLEEAKDCYIFTGKVQHKFLDGKCFVTNNDGTAYTGIYCLDGEPCFFVEGEIRESEVGLFIDKNKLYCFGTDSHAKAGWVKLSAGTPVGDLSDLSVTELKVDSYFYFDPKTYTAVSGWKNVPAPVINTSGNVSESGFTAKLYFSESATKLFYRCALVRNTDMVIKGKTYHFASDGTSVSEAINKSGLADNEYYSPRDYKVEKNVIRKIGKKWFYFDADGKMKDQISAKDIDGNPVAATFNADGSIKALSVKNTVIVLGDCYYAIGSNALPVTGLYKAPAAIAAKINGAGLFFESDGYSPKRSTSIYSIIKTGGKFYVVKGAVLQSGNANYTIRDCSSLPISDINSIEKYLRYEGKTITGGFDVYAFNGGLLKAGSVKAGDYAIHTNKYGLIYEDMSILIKTGGSWYVNSAVTGNKAGNMSLYLDQEFDDKYDYTEVNMCWDNKGKVTSINYLYNGMDTGIAATGLCDIEIGSGEIAVLNVNKGKIITSTKKTRFYGMEITLNFDPVIGISVTN